MEHKMTPKQQAFCEYYLETGNASEAARRAGYSPKTAFRAGQENMQKPAIREYIDKRLAVADEKRIAKADEVLQYLTSVMRGEEKDAFGLDASLGDRNKAAEMLAKRYGLMTERVEVVEPPKIVDDVDD